MVYERFKYVAGDGFTVDGEYVPPSSIIEILNKQHETIRNLENELYGMEELLKSYRKTIEHDAELLADATKNGYLPPLENWKGDV